MRALEGGYPEVARIIHGHPTLSEAVMEAGARRRRLADPRLRRHGRGRCPRRTGRPSTSTSPARWPTSRPSASLQRGCPARWSGSRCSRASCPARRRSTRFAAPRSGRVPRGRSSAARAALGLQPLRWPEPFPFDSSLAMRVATYAKSIGRAVPFAQAAFRQAFAGGHALERAGLRADRGGRLRDAPRGGAAGRASCARSPSSSRARTARARRRGGRRRTCPRRVSASASFAGEHALERARRAQHARRARRGRATGGAA